MAISYLDTGRESIELTNVSNDTIRVYDERTEYHFAPFEVKVLQGTVAIRLNAQNGNLKLPDQGSDATGNKFGKELPGNGVLMAQEV